MGQGEKPSQETTTTYHCCDDRERNEQMSKGRKLSLIALISNLVGLVLIAVYLTTSFMSSFQTTTGKITITLPSTIPFHLQTSNKGGKISNDFGSNDVGTPPRAMLQVTTKRGSIAIHDGGAQLASCA
jgi:hypothetical protein